MYYRVFLLICILSLTVIAKSQEGYEPEFIIIQPPAPSPPADYDPHATSKPIPPSETKVEAPAKPKEEPKRSKPPSKSVEAPEPAPKSAEKPEPPPAKEEPSEPEPPPPRPHPKAIPQKIEAKKEPKSAEASASSSATQADEPKSPPQNFKHDDCLSDTIFVIDSTSSVRNLFEQHRIYAANVVKEMDISPETNHIGVVLYSSKQRQSIKISLSDPQNKENITAKISSLPYLSGITATGAALHLTIKDLENRRANAMTNVVVISDGFSYDLVEEPVKQLQQMSNVRIFAVSLGESYRKYEMLLIASHEENFLTGADSYKELVRRLHQCNEGLRKGDEKHETKGDSQGQISTATEKTVISPPTTKAPKKEVSNEEKSAEKNVEKSKSKSSESSESSEEKESAAKTTTTTKKPIPATEKPKPIPATEKPKPIPVTEKPKPKPVEKSKPKGSEEKSKKKKKIEAAVSSEEKKSVEVKKPEVAPKKDSSSSSSSGDNKKDVIKNKDCRYDIVFVIDASGSLRKRYQHQLEIASKLIDKFDFEKTQIGVIRYSGRKRSKVAISLGSKHSKDEFNKEFLHMPFMGGTTFTDEALDKAFEEITGPNVRADALPMVIVFTDGFSQPDPAESAKKIHAKSIPTFAIGITDGQIVNKNELRSIASTPKNVFLDSNINELEQLFVQLSENC